MPLIKQLIIHFCGKREKITQLDFTKIKSVLLKPIGDAIGDAVAHTAHLNQIKQAFPSISIGVLTTDRNRKIFECCSLVDEILIDEPRTYFRQRKKWDLYLDFQPTFTTKSLIQDKILDPKYIFIFGKKNKKSYNLNTVKNYNYNTEISEQEHISNYLNFSLLKEYLSQDKNYYLLNVQPNDKKYWKSDKKKVLLAPFGSGRSIPVEELAELLNNLNNIKNIEFQLNSTKDSIPYFKKLKQLCPHISDLQLSEPMNILDFLSFVNSSDFIIAVDGGVVHISCALSKPLAAFYANFPVNINRWYPKNNKNIPTASFISLTENSKSNNDTENFPIDEAAEWINQQLEKTK